MRTRMKLEPRVAPKIKQRLTLVYAGAGFVFVSIAGFALFFYLNIGNNEDSYAQNQNYNTAAAGSWTSSSTWNGTPPPTDGLNKDNVNVNHNVTHTGDIIVNNETAITINGGAILSLIGDFVVNNNLTLNVNGTLSITGSLVAKNGAEVKVNGGGNVEISGDAEFQNNTNFWVDGNVNVGGTLSFNQNTTFGGNGYVSTGSTGCTDWQGQPANCSENMTLPVELLSFSAKNDNNAVAIQWKTSSELNNDYFNIERSTNGIDFESIAEIKGNGTTKDISDYEYTDYNPLQGLSYYRLVQTDFDGTSETFKPVSVTMESLAENNLEIYPNPLLGSTLKLKMDNPEEGNIEIYDQSGYKVFAKTLDGFSREEEMDLPGNLKKGIYFVNIQTSSVQKSFKLVKN